MNKKAAVFACRFTGFIGILASLFFGKVYGPAGLVLGLIGSMFWFGLAWYFQRSVGTG
ncbi:hypothetical protein C8P63_13325 [Melghirimyces profundicolus]|uniref:Uncharacterized protein n=1 Tax=Melghirimyces profundicolus TaxID=1242148 RepID=A0A2T6B633_9BACL|nr:hypothetical protein [Melghirimyces profundicolus]PTX51493.1 hypothetical protein C8P63_13325 [Melghirimyces profundicolus]